ncbi:multiple inositol polyphosphate phosphatase 1-like [Clytia hemisphaerica]|uniref:Multiple inositol polyphosphate phosphatase 1 n=1 Tax=Clytia hemisphaerica TaxID=252671 RepID=A0A7M6DJH0_9CNID
MAFCRLLICAFIAHSVLSSQEGLFSTKTPYSFIENDELNVTKPHPECIVKQINMVHRHGHRYPSGGDTTKFKQLSDKINTGRVAPGLNFTLPWYSPFEMKQKSMLTRTGEKELYGIGQRIKKRFPDLLKAEYSPVTQYFMSSNKVRTIHSANSIASGLFDGNGALGGGRIQPIAIDVSPKDPNDRLLRFYDACPKYIRNIDDKNETIIEYLKFQKGAEVQEVKKKVEQKLNLKDLSFTNLEMIYVGCAYQLGMFDGTLESGFCALLEKEDRQVFEYASDLEKFYTESNLQNPITYEIGCFLLKDILTTLEQVVENETESVGIFRSTHSQAVTMMFSLFGLNKQTTPLRHDNYVELLNRHFRSSIIAPFSANFYFVLYECSGEWKIQLYWNERLVKMPCCVSELDCGFDVFMDHYKDMADSCSETFDDLCDLPFIH